MCVDWSTPQQKVNLGFPHLVVSFHRSCEGSQGSVVRGTLCGKKKFLAPEMRAHWVVRCASSTMSAGLLKSSGRIGFELPNDHGPSLPRNEGCMLG